MISRHNYADLFTHPTPPSLHRFLTAAPDPSSDNLYFSAANQTGRLFLADCAENPAPGCSQINFQLLERPPHASIKTTANELSGLREAEDTDFSTGHQNSRIMMAINYQELQAR